MGTYEKWMSGIKDTKWGRESKANKKAFRRNFKKRVQNKINKDELKLTKNEVDGRL